MTSDPSVSAERRWAESLFESNVEGVAWEPDGRPLYDLTLDEIAAYERSIWKSWFNVTKTARLTRESFTRAMVGMLYPLRGPALDRPEGTYR